MRTFTRFMMVALMLCPFLTSCNSEGEDLIYDGELIERKDIVLTRSEQEMVTNSNAFAFNLFEKVRDDLAEGKSFMISPLSVTYALGMLNNGADGQTKEEICKVLGTDDVESMNAFCRKMIDESGKLDPSTKLSIANAVEVNQNYKLYEEFIKTTKDYYDAQVENLDFSSPSALKHINDWCANHTNNLIPTLLESLDPKAALPLVGMLSEEMTKNATVQAILPTLEARARTSIGDRFTDFEVVQDPADPHSAVKLSDYVGKGKTILLVFWASWCEENRKEMPGLKNIYEKYHGDDFDIVSIAVSDAPENSLAAAKEMGIMWNLIVNAQIIPLETYGVRRIPDMILFGPDGTILLRNFWGYDDLILDSIIGRYLRGERPAQPGVL